jgi:GDP/UDP-N,N'-diacetylbacillosamine 2-epimerase (hydrolysing)
MSRRISYVSGTRADFGLMARTLGLIDAAADLDLSVVVTGMHLSPPHGETVREIEAAALRIAARVPVALEPSTGATMARGIGAMVTAFTDVFEAERPDIVLLLGDRGEMLAGAIAALHLNIAVAHIHGGERSGTVDEPVRHAISKLAHLHMAATESAQARLIAMGENAKHVHVTGAPGLDGLDDAELPARDELMRAHGLDPAKPFALMVFHPVLQEAGQAEADAAALLAAMETCETLVLMPNADAGSDGVRAVLESACGRDGLALVTHLARPDFLAAMARADVMTGNSSAGIIEAASFGTPVVNVGRRQQLRERNANVRDVAIDEAGGAIAAALAGGRFAAANIYGDGQAAMRIVTVLRETAIDAALMNKMNSY